MAMMCGRRRRINNCIILTSINLIFAREHGIIYAVPAIANSIATGLETNPSVVEKLLQLEAENQQLTRHNTQLVERNTWLTEEINWFKSQMFGRSSEKSTAEVSPDQRMLFNEAEVLAAIAAADAQESTQTTNVDAHERQKQPGRKAIPEKFPRTRVVHDIPESEKVCPIDGTPPKLIVLQHVRPKYASGCKHGGVRIAPVPLQVLKSTKAPSSYHYMWVRAAGPLGRRMILFDYVPIASAFKQWLDEIVPGVPPKSALGKAIAYSVSQRPKLVRYLDHPEIPPDNNRVEQFETLLPWNVKQTLKQFATPAPSINQTRPDQPARLKSRMQLIETINAE